MFFINQKPQPLVDPFPHISTNGAKRAKTEELALAAPLVDNCEICKGLWCTRTDLNLHVGEKLDARCKFEVFDVKCAYKTNCLSMVVK